MLDIAGGSQQSAPAAPQPVLQGADKPSSFHQIMAAIILGISLLATLAVFFSARAEQSRAANFDRQKQDLITQTQTGELGQVAADVVRIAQIKKLLAERAIHTTIWSGLLKDFQVTSTPGISIQSIAIDDRNTLKVEGFAPNYQTIATYLATLGSSAFFRDIQLVSSAVVTSDQGVQTNFSISMTVKTEAAAVAVEETL